MLKFMLANITGTPSLNLVASNVPAKKLYESFGFFVTSDFAFQMQWESCSCIRDAPREKLLTGFHADKDISSDAGRRTTFGRQIES